MMLNCNKFESIKINRFIDKFTFSIVIVFCLLSILQLFYNRNLWLDEAALALNFNRGFWELFKPLDGGQVAPLLYLQIVKLSTKIFGNNEIALRLPSVVFYISSIILLVAIFKEQKIHRLISFFALILFFLNTTIFYYSTELKQYMADVFSAILIFYIFLKIKSPSLFNTMVLSISGFLIIWLSNVSAIMLFSLAIIILLKIILESNRLKNIIMYGPVLLAWLVSVLLNYFLVIKNHPTHNFMIDFWMANGGFLVQGNFIESLKIFFMSGISTVFSDSILSFSISLISIILLILFKRYKLVIILVLPIIIHFIFAILRIYPASPRLTLYFIPINIILIGTVFNEIIRMDYKGFLGKIKNPFIFLVLAIVMTIQIVIVPKNVFAFSGREEITQAIDIVQENIKKSDVLYVYYGAVQAYKYYLDTDRFQIKNSVVFGSNLRKYPEKYIDEIPVENRTWLLFSHIRQSELKKIKADLLSKEFTIEFDYPFQGSELLLIAPKNRI